jgi:hypothetical protein
VTWNGEPRAATVAYDTRIDLPVSESDVAAPGLISIGVTNPGGAPESVADLVVVPSHAHSAWLVYEHWGSGSVTASRVDGSGYVTVAGGATRVDASPVAFKAVYHWDDRIHEVDFLTGQTRRVTPVGIPLQTESWARYSTDGAWVYFVGQPSHGRSEIWRARLDGSVAERVIGDPSASLSSPSLSRDGTRIVYARTESGAGPLWIHDIASSTSTPLGTDGQMSRWSPTDDYIVYLTDNWSLRVIEPDGSGDRNLLNVVNVGHAFDFAPDGMSIVGTTQGGEPIRISFPGGIATPLVGIPQIGSIAAFAP